MFLLVIGCGRSGTRFISSLLQKNKIDVPHEMVGSEGIVGGDIAAFQSKERSRCTRGISPYEAWARRTHVFHQVRAPLPAIRSIAMTGNWNFVNKWCPEVRGASRILKSMRYWFFWNKRCHEIATWTYQVEKLESLCEEFSRRLGREVKWHPELPTTLNTRKHLHGYPHWTEDDLWEADGELARRIFEQAMRYGYSDLGE